MQSYQLGSFSFQDGTILPNVVLTYREFNPNGKKTALVPTCFRGRIDTTWSFREGALKDYRVIVVALLGNGESSSPSNTPNFPPRLDYQDCVRAQKRLVTEHLNISTLDVIVGFSMGGQCAYHWSAMYPEMVRNAVIICSSAKTSLHNYQFLEGPKAALINSIDYDDGKFESQNKTPIRGLHAFGRAYSAWLTSAEWFEKRMFEKLGSKSLEEWANNCVKGYEDWHADDLLVMLGMWQRGDISGINGETNTMREALERLKTRILLMPSQTDQYFRWEASEKEISFLSDAELAIIPSIWGHFAGGGINPEDNKWMDEKITRFLDRP
ncbi:uncharacterized protein PFLUO_LOCUS4538 [Penicillium psychrofluorescens]|uniref:uncharacterized protein n=1 Tax=Penicillium psychrofluorescens TaxID=3158075 RepID=UPI003CCD4D6B